LRLPNGSPARDLSGRVQRKQRSSAKDYAVVKQGFREQTQGRVADVTTLTKETPCIRFGPAHRYAMPTDHVPPPPDAGRLYEAALNHLARYAATELGLRRVLTRRIDRWARLQTDPEAAAPVIAAARDSIDAVIIRLVKAGAISDSAYAENRAKSLTRTGRSHRAIHASLIAKGIAPDLARSATGTDPETELAAALVLVRKRRIGPYRTNEDADPAIRLKEMGLLARAGFSRDIAEQALATSREDAESRIFELRR
jgi:regulatory protein